MTHPTMDEALGRIAAAHLEAADALHRLVEAINGRGATARLSEAEPEPAAEPAPGEWRNDRAPAGSDEADDGKVWCWYGARLGRSIREHLCTSYALGARPWWSPGNQPAPTSPPPKSFTGKWIVGPLPTEADANFENDVKVPNVLDPTCPYEWAKYYVVQPGAPWCSPDDNPGPWDPTTLDRNGWIRSRLPTENDTSLTNMVQIPVGRGGTTSTIAYDLIIPGQPWAPWDSTPGRFEK